MLPSILKESGIDKNNFIISDEAWAKIVRPLGYDAGIRTLERTIKAMTRKVARKIIEGDVKRFEITPENVREFMPQ